MAKKKWYVVTVGRSTGVFESWLEVAPLISGISGALHESFSSREEAERVFEKEQAKGSTRVVGASSSSTNTTPKVSLSTSTSASSSLAHPATTSTASKVQDTSTKSVPTPPSLHKGSTSPALPRSPSPVVMYSNVTYTRGSSSSPRVSRHATPRAVVQTPPDIKSYPSDSEPTSASSPSYSIKSAETPRKGQHKSEQSAYTSPVQRSLSTPVFPGMYVRPPVTHPIRAAVMTPSNAETYPSGGDSTPHASSPPRTKQDTPLLSPLGSPRFFTPEELGHTSERPSPKHSSPRVQKSHSGSLHGSPSKALPSGIMTSDHGNQPRSVIHIVAPSNSDHSQCHHTCPNCRHSYTYITGVMVPLALSQPPHVQSDVHEPIHDPRSPMANNIAVPVAPHSLSFARPSPVMKAEDAMSALFVSG